MSLLRRASPLVCLGLLAVSACAGSLAPKVAPRGTLTPGSDALAGRDEGPFAVVHLSPSGEIDGDAEVTVAWSRALHALGPTGAPPPVTLTPTVPGSWSWVGSRAARFSAKSGLPRGTEFTVTIPAGTKALDGSTLSEAKVGTFTTSRPRLLSSTPREGTMGLPRDVKVELRFNQPIAKTEIERAARIEGPSGKIAFTATPGDSPDVWRLAPTSSLPEDAAITVVVDESLRGTEGPLTAKKASTIELHTYGPLLVSGLTCSQRDRDCRPNGWVSLAMSNRVKAKDLRDAIKVDPPVKLNWPTFSDDQLVSSVYLDGDFKAGRSYTVTVKPSKQKPLVDEFKQPLARDGRLSFSMADHDPEVELGVDGTYLEPSLAADVPVFSTNVAKLKIAASPLTVEGVLEVDALTRRKPTEIVDSVAARTGSFSTTVSSGGRNRLGRHTIPLSRVLGAGGKGTAEIAVSWQDGKNTRTRDQIVQVTDLGITAKVEEGSALVWVTRLSTGKPVSDAEVSLRFLGEAPPAPIKVDANGFARIALPATAANAERKTGIIVARAGDDWSYRRSDDTLELYRFGASDSCRGCESGRALLFTDRGIYRPGDKVKVKGIVRTADKRGLSAPVGKKVSGIVKGPEGEELSRFSAVLSTFGSFHEEVTVPETAKLGSYEVELTLDGEEGRRGAASFEVAEFRPTELEVKVETDRRDYVRGDELSCQGKGMYLFGAPMNGSDGHMEIVRSQAYFSPPGAETFETSDATYRETHRDESPRSARLVSRDAKLDRDGKLSSTVKLDMPGQTGTETVECETEVKDLSRQTFSSMATAFVHPGEVYVGVRAANEGFVKSGEPVRAEIIAIEPSGKRRAGNKVKVELFRRSWKISRVDAGGGRMHSDVVAVDTSVGTCAVTTDDKKPAGCELRASESGYHVLRATSADARGNAVAASSGVYVVGAGVTAWADGDDQRVDLVPDKKSYKVGETAKILVKLPFPDAEAWITVEREGVMSSERRVLSGATPTIEIPVTQDFLPNVFVGVHLLRGRTKAPPGSAKKADVGGPAYRTGFVPIVIDHQQRRLAVRVKPRKSELAPGERATVDVDVRDASDKPVAAEVTLYAVDEGVLSLIGYKTPDPVATFFAPRSLGVATLESRESMARVAKGPARLGPGLDKGLDGGGGGGTRHDFRQTAVFLPALKSDGNGHAEASFDMPDSLSSFRVMAVVTGADDRFGSADARVVTSKPLMARPALPRVLRAGDSLEASVIITSKGVAPGNVDVSLSTEGLVQEGDAKKRVELGRGESKEARFSIKAREAGRAKLTFVAEGGGQRDAVSALRDVIAPVRLESAAVFGDTETAAGEALGKLDDVRGDVGGLTLSVAPTALVALAGGLDQLVEYPYGCTEQLTSRLVPLLPLRELAKSLGTPLPADVDVAVNKTVAKVQQNQHDDGGFGLWPESTDSSAWLTSYALWGLSTAKQHGVPVRQASIDHAQRYLTHNLSTAIDRDPASACFIVDVLASSGKPEAGAATKLYEKRGELPVFAKALLLSALHKGGGDAAAKAQLVTEIMTASRIDGPYAIMTADARYHRLLDSDARASGMVLRALAEVEPKHALVPKLAQGLLSVRKGGRWRTTQETTWALLGLEAYRKAVEATPPAFDARVFLGESELFHTRFDGTTKLSETQKTPMSQLMSAGGAVLAFEKKGQGHLFYEARLKFGRKRPITEPIEQGFFLEKSLAVVTPETLQAAIHAPIPGVTRKLTAGDLVLVTLTLVAPSPRDFVVIDDPLPGGLEAIDANLRGASKRVALGDREADEGDDEERDRWWYTPLTRKELRDDRALFFADALPAGLYRYRYLARATSIGKFSMPATRVEEMYVPETFGQTPDEMIEVVAP